MNVKQNLRSRIRGWFPQEPQFPSKPMKIKLETNPLRLRQKLGKSSIYLVQFIGVMLAISLILGGLYLTGISNEKTTYNLPVYYEGTHAPIVVNGANYNYTIKIFVEAKFEMGIFGSSTSPISLYLNEPNNLTAGVYVVKLQYVSYNASTNAYVPRTANYSYGRTYVQTTPDTPGTSPFSPNPNKKLDLIASTAPMEPPLDDSSSDQIVKNVVFTLYCNDTGKMPSPAFNLTSPIDDSSQGGYVVTYPYRNQGNLLLAVGILSLLAALIVSLISLSRNFGAKKPIVNSELIA